LAENGHRSTPVWRSWLGPRLGSTDAAMNAVRCPRRR
jgi:hypothetical protein